MSRRVEVLGCTIDALTMNETVDRCIQIVESGETVQQVSINAAKLVAIRTDADLNRIVNDCGLVSADGQSVVWASRLLGSPLPERVAGIDLMHRLVAIAVDRGWRLYMLGAKSDVLETAVAKLRDLHPGVEIVGYRDGYFRDDEREEIAARIRAARANVLFVAMSSPQKEYWLAEHGHDLGIPLLVGVGGAIDIIAGVTKRAPTWMQRVGLEWFFRLTQEPRRLGGRYVKTNMHFLAILTRELMRPRREAGQQQ